MFDCLLSAFAPSASAILAQAAAATAATNAVPAAVDTAAAPASSAAAAAATGLQIGVVDIVIFFAFIAAVIAVGLLKSRRSAEEGAATSESFFLAGRGLKWWLIGISLIAANISTEQFVGMSGNAADFGMAVASYEWMAAVTLVVVAFCFLPYFLRTGIYTIPHFLEHRYNGTARTIMATFTMVILIGVSLAAVIYAGALMMRELFAGSQIFGGAFASLGLVGWSWVVGVMAAIYVCAGGLKASAWADLIQGVALIAAGVVIAWLAMNKLGATPLAALTAPEGITPLAGVADDSGAFAKLNAYNHAKLTMFLPADDKNIPWTALLLGLWIPNFYYWGLNQYITQRVLGSASLGEGQKGIVFAAGLKLIIPFAIVIPGIVAFNLYSGELAEAQHRVNVENIQKITEKETAAALGKTYFAMDPRWENAHAADAEKVAARNAAVLAANGLKRHEIPALTGEFSDGAKTLARAREVVDACNLPAFSTTLIDAPHTPASDATREVKEQWRMASDALARHNAGVFAGAGVEVKKLGHYKFDASFSLLMKNLLPVGLVGFVVAAMLGAIVSSLAAVLNAASTIFTMDIYQKHLAPAATESALVRMGRITVLVFAVIGCVLAPLLEDYESIFKYIQEFQGYISPGILAVFVFGILNRRAPGAAGVTGLLLSPALYGLLSYGPGWLGIPEIAFLNRMALCFFVIMGTMWCIGLARPLDKPVEFKINSTVALETSKFAKFCGITVVILVALLYVLFSPLVLAR